MTIESVSGTIWSYRRAKPKHRAVLEAVFPQPETAGVFAGDKMPTLLVWGKQDAIIPVNCGGLYQQALAHATLHVIDRCAPPVLEKPQEFVRVVREFLAKHGQSASR